MGSGIQVASRRETARTEDEIDNTDVSDVGIGISMYAPIRAYVLNIHITLSTAAFMAMFMHSTWHHSSHQAMKIPKPQTLSKAVLTGYRLVVVTRRSMHPWLYQQMHLCSQWHIIT